MIITGQGEPNLSEYVVVYLLSFSTQAWNHTETNIALVLALVPLQKFPVDFRIVVVKVPFANGSGLVDSKMRIEACNML